MTAVGARSGYGTYSEHLVDRPGSSRNILGKSGLDDLSPREFEITRLASDGLSNKEIAKILDISPHTVSSHMRRIYDKLGVHRRAQLASVVALSTRRAAQGR